MPPAPCPPCVWRGRAAEELLNYRERRASYQDPDYVARPRPKNTLSSPSAASLRPTNTQAQQERQQERFVAEVPEAEPPEADLPDLSDQDGLMQLEFARSFSAPLLKPLGPPALIDSSPFASKLGFLSREPAEFSIQRDTAKRREATKLLRRAYRIAIESLGHRFFEPDPWPSKPVPRPDPVTSGSKISPLSQQPFAVTDGSKPRKQAMTFDASRSTQSPGRISKRKETIQFMKTFGRGALGGPYTIGQVYQEVEADVHHRYPADVRALYGMLGPAILGPGTTRMRRKLPFTHPQLAISN
eukprot:TRINITY_DN98379_c0_g1_i1.p1 TRINITY_DN98379_c0_g1~~TRINITY_DN98379_c0_g1_i1.p1  ORF type:complete len:300 (+),score=38.38 TRINITY_DN98379_c0_g1_i1:84-983(+)